MSFRLGISLFLFLMFATAGYAQNKAFCVAHCKNTNNRIRLVVATGIDLQSGFAKLKTKCKDELLNGFSASVESSRGTDPSNWYLLEAWLEVEGHTATVENSCDEID